MRSAYTNGVCRCLLAGALVSAIAGCGDADDDRGDETVVPQGINGELVYALNVGPDHTIQFFEFEEGERAAVLEIGADGDPPLLHGMGTQDQSLAAVFSKLRPQQPVPSRILATDQRVLHKRSLRQAVTPAAEWVTAEPAAAASVVGRPAEAISAVPANCSADQAGDGWSGQWFKDNLCLGTCNVQFFPVCNVNWGWSDYSAAASDYFQYEQMEGDWNVSGSTSAYTTGFPYPSPHYWWTVSLAPRHYAGTYFSGSGVSWQTNHFKASSPCGHLHTTDQICD